MKVSHFDFEGSLIGPKGICCPIGIKNRFGAEVETLNLRCNLSCDDCVAISWAARPAGGGEIAVVRGCRGALGGRAGDPDHDAFDTSKATPIIAEVNRQTSQSRERSDHI